MSAAALESLLASIRKRCKSGLWSQGVALARAGAVAVESQSADEMVLRVDFHRIERVTMRRQRRRTRLEFDDDFFGRMIRGVFFDAFAGGEMRGVTVFMGVGVA